MAIEGNLDGRTEQEMKEEAEEIFASLTANLHARIESEVKEEAEKILSSLGIPVSNAIYLFYKQIISHGGIPWLPAGTTPPISINNLTRDELDAQMKKERRDILAGKARLMSVEEFHERLEKKFGPLK